MEIWNWNKIKQLWKDWKFEIILVLAIVTLVIYALYRIGKNGSWSSWSSWSSWKDSYSLPKKRRPPTESRGEKECRRVLEKLFSRPFPKARPDFLRNPVTGGIHNLELDCYNQELKLAVEYSGIQHYRFVPYFHKNKEAFQNQKYRDYMKKRCCEDNGIRLIEVPYTVKVDEIENYLKKILIK